MKQAEFKSLNQERFGLQCTVHRGQVCTGINNGNDPVCLECTLIYKRGKHVDKGATDE